MTAFEEENATVEAIRRYVHLILIVFLIAVIVPFYQLIQNLYCRHYIQPRQIELREASYHRLGSNMTPSNRNDRNSIANLSTFLKLVLSSSICFSLLYNLNTTMHTPLYFINHGMKTWICKLISISAVLTYILARTLLYIFFLKRTQTLFKETVFRYNSFMINSLITIAIFIAIFITLPTFIVQLFLETNTIETDINGNGQFCHSSPKYNHIAGYKIIAITWIFGALFDSLFEFISMYLLVSKLFAIIHIQNEFKCLKKVTDQPEYIPINFGDNQDTFIIHKSVSTTPSLSRTVTREDVVRFHSSTDKNNHLIMLISKLCILFFVVIVSSQVCIVLFVMMPYLVLIWYSLDSMLNVYCLWLMFSFTEKYFVKYFCGEKCMKKCFPLVKSAALVYYDDYKDEENHINKMNGWKLCCCFCCCRHCVNYPKRDEHKEIYAITCAEMNLIIES